MYQQREVYRVFDRIHENEIMFHIFICLLSNIVDVKYRLPVTIRLYNKELNENKFVMF